MLRVSFEGGNILMAQVDNNDWYEPQNGVPGSGQRGKSILLFTGGGVAGCLVGVLSCICLFFVFAVWVVSATGNDGFRTTLERNIEVGSSDSATLDSLISAHNWLFSGEAGQQVTIRVNGRGDTDPRAKLIDPNGNVIAEDDDGGSGLDSLILITLPSDGTYTVRVAVFVGGTYDISIE